MQSKTAPAMYKTHANWSAQLGNECLIFVLNGSGAVSDGERADLVFFSYRSQYFLNPSIGFQRAPGIWYHKLEAYAYCLPTRFETWCVGSFRHATSVVSICTSRTFWYTAACGHYYDNFIKRWLHQIVAFCIYPRYARFRIPLPVPRSDTIETEFRRRKHCDLFLQLPPPTPP